MASERNIERVGSDDEQNWSLVAERLTAETEEQVPSSFWLLARLYEDGRGVERDLARAFELRVQGAELDEPNAVVELAYSYEFAVGTPYDLDRAQALYERALALSPEFETRGFACCHAAAPTIVKHVKRVYLQEVERDGEVGSAISLETNEEIDQSSVQALLDSISPEDSPYFCMALADLLRDKGEPKTLAEETARGLCLQATELLSFRASQGNGVAAGSLAAMSSCGVLEPLDPEIAVQLLELGVDAGYPPALVTAGHAFELDGNFTEAFELYRMAEDAGYDEGICKVGLAYRMQGDEDAAFERFQRGAALDHAPSLYFLSSHYEEVGDPESLSLALEYLKRSSDLGFPFAQERYANYLCERAESGENVDWTEIAKLFESAMNMRLDSSKVSYACLLNKGLGVEQDVWEAARLFSEIAEEGDDESKELLAKHKLEGDFCDYDPKGAIELLEEIGERRPAALVVLGFMYFSGENVEQDLGRAAALFGRAAAERDPIGASNFARCCNEGIGVSRNELYGEYFLRLAVELHEPNAAFILGKKYESGDGVKQNMTYAEHWYRRAVVGGVAEACVPLAECYWNGLGVKRNELIAKGLWELGDCCGDPEAVEEHVRSKLSRDVELAFGFEEPDDYSDQETYAARRIFTWLSEIAKRGKSTPDRKQFLLEYISALGEFEVRSDCERPQESSSFDETFGALPPGDAIRSMYRVCVENRGLRELFGKGTASEK